MPALAVELEHDVAEVEAEVIAVDSLATKHLVLIRQCVEDVVEVVVVGQRHRGNPVGLLNYVLEGRPGAGEQLGNRNTGSVGVGDRVGDVGFPFRQSADQIGQGGHRFVQLVALPAQ